MKQIISAGPLPRPSDFLRPPGPRPFPLGNPRTSYWYCARTAIVQGCLSIGLRAGDRVLAPAYACGSEIDALVGAGLRLEYYRVRPDLSVDLDHVEHVCRAGGSALRALFVTHYFGFAQDMDSILAFARARDLVVMEDNAHGLYSRDPGGRELGSLGNASVFSFTKSLAVPDGGALVLDASVPSAPDRGRRPELFPVAGKARYLFEQAVEQKSRGAGRFLRQSVLDPLARRVKSQASVPHVESKEGMDLIGFRRERVDWRISTPARLMLRASLSRDIPDIRRSNYSALLAGIETDSRARALLPLLPNGCCPLMFPILVDDPRGLLRHLSAVDIRAKHFWSFSHPDVPMQQFPFEAELKKNTVALPVHQDLDRDDMARIAEAVRVWRRGGGRVVH
jgi:dTDP-4-amino-4,6-dideoxygalactose transaminase